MNSRHIPLCALLLASPLTFGAPLPPAAADGPSELPTVSVSVNQPATAIRHDVRATCPEIDAALQQSLAPAWGRVQAAGTMRVKFRIEGDRITDVASSGLSWDYRSQVRRAVTALKCTVPAGAEQTFEFLLSIRAPQDSSNPERFAMQIE